jgi:hypothetical protein
LSKCWPIRISTSQPRLATSKSASACWAQAMEGRLRSA